MTCRLPRWSGLSLGAGAAGATAAFVLRSLGLPWADAAALVSLLVFLPLLALLQARALQNLVVERKAAYATSALTLLALGGGVWLVGARSGGARALGLTPLSWNAFIAWTLALIAAGLALTAAFRAAGRRLGMRESRLLRDLLPRTPRERVTFAGLSLAAGAAEELAFRGYVIPVLGAVLGVPLAAAASSLVFGILHAYQGPLGVARSATLGGALAVGFLASGSLWPAVVAHTALDVLLGAALGERMMVPEEN